ncbi:hypothetical protein A9308_07070 [Moraxella atlantae]|uniref:Uncharacterized protein n=1 Tax=Faucicola atlantae TaxID=34059 RepID=A0A1B8QBS0_9GAMM|nr:hypothetical protein A9308_07070 [Moraxella atlantae]
MLSIIFTYSKNPWQNPLLVASFTFCHMTLHDVAVIFLARNGNFAPPHFVNFCSVVLVLC